MVPVELVVLPSLNNMMQAYWVTVSYPLRSCQFRVKNDAMVVRSGKLGSQPRGLLHIDIFALPRLGEPRRYLLVMIDRATD